MFYLFSRDIGVLDNTDASLNSQNYPSDSHFTNPKGNTRGNLPMTRSLMVKSNGDAIWI